MSVCQLLEPSDENTLNHLANILKDRATKRNALIPDLAQRGMTTSHLCDISATADILHDLITIC